MKTLVPSLFLLSFTMLNFSACLCTQQDLPTQATVVESAKAVVEPSYASTTTKSYSGKSKSSSTSTKRTYQASTSANQSNYYAANSSEQVANPSSKVRIVSRSEARSILSAHGVDYAYADPAIAGGLQLDEIPVALTGPNEVVIVEVSDTSKSVNAEGRDVVILGSTSKVTVNGNCGRLLVSGGKNVVNTGALQNVEVHGNSNHLTLGETGSGEIHGNWNRVDWTRPGPKPPLVTNGTANQIAEPR